MRNFALSTSLLLFSVSLIAQIPDSYAVYNFSFEDTTHHHSLIIDSNSIWQIGTPSKTTFTSPYSWPNVICTDTINPYPLNDTSSFTVIHKAYWCYPNKTIGAGISFYYMLDTDTLNDHWGLYVSFDKGQTWYDMFNDTAVTNYYSYGSYAPEQSGSYPIWMYCQIILKSGFPNAYNINLDDSVLYRFVFYSDSIDTQKDGVMLDDITFYDYIEGIDSYQADSQIKISPNPAKDIINFGFPPDIVDGEVTIAIYDMQGRKTCEFVSKMHNRELTIQTAGLAPGLWLFKIITKRREFKGKVIISN